MSEQIKCPNPKCQTPITVEKGRNEIMCHKCGVTITLAPVAGDDAEPPTHRCNGVNRGARHGTQNACTVCGEYREGWYDSGGMEVLAAAATPAPSPQTITVDYETWLAACGVAQHNVELAARQRYDFTHLIKPEDMDITQLHVEVIRLRELAMPITDPELAEVQRLYEASTQGEWWANIHACVYPTSDSDALGAAIAECLTDNDAAWIAAAHNLWPRLVARQRELESTLKEFRKSDKLISDSYLRIRKLVGAWDTNTGGEDRFEVTEAKVADLAARAQGAEAVWNQAIRIVKDAEAENLKMYRELKEIVSNEKDWGLMQYVARSGEDSRIVVALETARSAVSEGDGVKGDG